MFLYFLLLALNLKIEMTMTMIVLMVLMHVSCARNNPSEDYNRTVRKLKYTLIISILFLGHKGSNLDHQHLFGITK